MDISIKNLNSYIFDLKSETTRIARAKEIVSMDMTVSEKVDGTKLTLIRTNASDPANFEKNWIVAYKGSVLNASEFSHLSDKDKESVKTTSIGIGQYSQIFDHLRKINGSISSIPTDTEFSIEFAQNKDTLTRTYKTFGAMFLRSFAKVRSRVLNGKLYSHPTGEEITDTNRLTEMAKLLKIRTFPIYFIGKLNKVDVSKNAQLSAKMSDVNWNDPIDIIKKFSAAVLSIESTLGGTTEGAVIKLADGRFFKVVQSDQYDTDIRSAKKDLYRMSPEETSEYFKKMRKLINVVLSKIDVKKSNEETLAQANKLLAKIPIDKFPKNDKKNEIQIRDDAHETLRMMLDKRNMIGHGVESIGLIPIAGKPLHIGHWKLIEKAANENDRVIVYTTEKDRIEKDQFPIKGEDFVYFWNDMFIPILPNNVKVTFVDSPVRSVMHELAWFEQSSTQDGANIPTARLYSDASDIESNFKESDLSKYPTLKQLGKIEKVGVERSSTVNVSGTKMREFLKTGDKESFKKNLPPVKDSDKDEIWNTLVQKGTVKEKFNMDKLVTEVVNAVFADIMLMESGQSIAAVSPTQPKSFNGQPAMASTKLKIVDADGNDIGNKVSADIKEFSRLLNSKVGFWKQNNPYIENGYIFNGSSQHLMNPKLSGKISKVKNSFGDIDIIIPKAKLDELESYLDSIDDNVQEWEPTTKNKLTPTFHYVGRTRSSAAIPDQLVTLWYYVPKKQIVQIDFEGDDMTTDASGFEKPSDWTKFTKDSPYTDLEAGIKGLAGALMLRALARATTRKDGAVVVKPTSAAKIKAGQTVITSKDIRIAGGVPDQATGRTLNTGGGGAGMRLAYKKVGDVTLDGKPVEAYVKMDAGDVTGADRTTNIPEIFETFFGKKPTASELKVFRSFTGLLGLMKKYLDVDTITYALNKFDRDISSEHMSDNEWAAIYGAIQSITGIKRTPPK